jgi:hypothetical protein
MIQLGQFCDGAIKGESREGQTPHPSQLQNLKTCQAISQLANVHTAFGSPVESNNTSLFNYTLQIKYNKINNNLIYNLQIKQR